MTENETVSAPFFTHDYLVHLIVPLVAEQFLAVTIGAADTLMVASCGEAAVSGVSLIDQFSQLMIQLFAAFATGGAVVASQYLGRKDERSACASAKQLMYLSLAAGVIITVLCLPFRKPMLAALYGKIDADVMENALAYFVWVSLSFPFLAVYSSCAALFRSMGNSRLSLIVSLLMNVINIGGNAALIYGAGLGAAGAGMATFASRAVAAVIMFVLLCDAKKNSIYIERLLHFEWNGSMNVRILRVGIPSGIENSIFQIGKVIVQTFMAGFGTAAIAANAISGNIANFANIPGNAMGLAAITVIGQCIGAGEKKQAVYYSKRFMKYTYSAMDIFSLLIFIFTPQLVSVFNLSSRAESLSVGVIRSCMIGNILVWPLSFVLPNMLRAAGDATFTMTVSSFSMIVFRIISSYLISFKLLKMYPADPGIALYGVWFGMYIDWIFRAIIFVIRFSRGKWLEKKVI